jgi:uncharacterized protein YbjQ (UPF0145 family)
MKLSVIAPLFVSAAVLAGCATWSTTSVDATPGAQAAQGAEKAPRAPNLSAAVRVTEQDITDRKYRSLGDISVTVNKTTIFHPDPTKEAVIEQLREKAAEMGADAVVLARFGAVGIGLMSWGSIDGKGRAVVFED